MKTTITGMKLIALLLFSPVVFAEGLVGSTGHGLSDAQVESLKSDISDAKAQFPSHFQAVSKIVSNASKLDAGKRGRMVPFEAMFKRLGESAHMALLEMVLFDGPTQGDLKDDAWFALRSGIIEAAGRSRDIRLIPALEAYLHGPETEFYAIRAATEALGKVGTNAAVGALLGAVDASPLKKGAMVSGMGYCRREAVAQYLAGQLATSTSDEMTDTLIKSLRDVGNAYAWKTAPMKRFSEEENAVRRIAAKALFDHYTAASDGMLRNRSLKGLVVVNHPDTRNWIDSTSKDSSEELRSAMNRLERRLHVPK